MDGKEPLVTHSEELRFTIVAKPFEYHVEYTIYDIDSWREGSVSGQFDKPYWHRKGSNSWPDPVDSIEDAEPYLHGRVKWDGCSDWHFDEQDKIMLHGCCRSDVQRLGDVMALCWDMTEGLLPTWIG